MNLRKRDADSSGLCEQVTAIHVPRLAKVRDMRLRAKEAKAHD
jgi:hypothetical protein